MGRRTYQTAAASLKDAHLDVLETLEQQAQQHNTSTRTTKKNGTIPVCDTATMLVAGPRECNRDAQRTSQQSQRTSSGRLASGPIAQYASRTCSLSGQACSRSALAWLRTWCIRDAVVTLRMDVVSVGCLRKGMCRRPPGMTWRTVAMLSARRRRLCA